MFKQKVLFTKEECREILNEIEEVKQAKVVSERGASGYGKSFRKSKISHFNSDKVKDIILPKISSIDSTIISLPKIINIVKYNKGDYFKIHADSSDGVHEKRLKTLIIQLSDNTYNGCILKVYKNTTNHICSSEIGNTIIFDSTCKHEVTPMLKGERYALVCWLEKNNLHYKQTII